ncbi:MAG: hypothetical protein AAGD07_19735 [Planctomycetota bacterium]
MSMVTNRWLASQSELGPRDDRSKAAVEGTLVEMARGSRWDVEKELRSETATDRGV